MNFKAIALKEWQQFQYIDIDFGERLTILTGANGSGKTTILNILSRHAGWQHDSLATPKLDKKTGLIKFFNRLFKGEDKSRDRDIGSITYDDNTTATLSVPEDQKLQYTIKIKNQKAVKCLLIPSHGAVYFYQPLENLPAKKKNISAAYSEVSDIIRNRYRGVGGHPSSFYMKNTLIGWAIQGFGVQDGMKVIMAKDRELIEYYKGFQGVLKKYYPSHWDFKSLK